MTPSDLRWVRVDLSPAQAETLQSLSLPGQRTRALRADAGVALELAAESAAPGTTFELPDLSEFATPLAKAHFLLDTASEIEQALMVQYLYAGYSLKDSADPSLPTDQSASVRQWQRAVVQIAKEEMGHLMTVQNLLLFIGQTSNMEREDFPPRKNLYPFPMHLEPLNQRSLARYVVAESPYDAAGIEDIIKLATSDGADMVNRVGILYAILGVVFSRHEDLEANAAISPWYRSVRDVANLLYSSFPDQPIAEWHLPDSAFQPATVSIQADPNWGGGAIRVFRVSSRTECLNALQDISVQGEGLSMGSGTSPAASHFERFLAIYRGTAYPLPFPAEGDWLPTISVPTNPFVDRLSSDANAISDEAAVEWAELANLRYSLLLGMLQQYFTSNEQQRTAIVDWCVFGAMLQLRALSEKLVTLHRRGNAMVKAALPFTLPGVINLPPDAESRLALLKRRLQRSIARIDRLIAGGNTDSVLPEMKNSDEGLLRVLLQIDGPVIPPDTPPAGETAMRQLLEQLQPRAQSRHGGIPTGGSTLRQLFVDRNYDAILTFLGSANAIRPPFAGQKLIVPGKPEDSAFYRHITDESGVMSGIFDASQIATVHQWISQLPPTGTAPPKEADPLRDMLQLLKSKRVPGQIMHDAIQAGSGKTLSDLFKAEDYDGIIDFLKSGRSVVGPFGDLPLIQPGKPAESAFFLQISDPGGVMSGRFTADDIAIVERWIRSLGSAVIVPLPATIRTTAVQLADGLAKPVFVTAPAGDTKRLFIVEQSGKVRILKLATNKVSATPCLSLSDISTGGERGLLGLAFHPDFAQNGTFFVNCTNPLGHTEIRSYHVSDSSPDKATLSSKKIVLSIAQPFANHNGGWMAFGPRDGFLYIGTGDGGSGNDPRNNGQNLDTLLGKMLRIDVNRDDFPGDEQRNYAIPPSNPFVGRTNVRPEIWAYGLRNPWRNSFDRATGDLYIGDVGQGKREEINFQPASSAGGENYGWRLKEGTLDTGLGDSGNGFASVPPIHEYSPSDGIAVIGGYVYRGDSFPVLQGTYFFGDFRGSIWSGRRGAGQLTDVVHRSAEIVDQQQQLEGLSSFGEDAAGELYFTTLSGSIYRIEGVDAAVTENRWDDVARLRVHPAIGIMRVGNAGFRVGRPTIPAASEDYFVGPEHPYESSPPSGGYKKNGRVRRQAARFRVFAYDSNDQLIGEVTSERAEITWTVELANRKASFRKFDGLSANGSPRNPSVTGADRAGLEITPGPRSITGSNEHAAFDNGSFRIRQGTVVHTANDIYLGEIQSDAAGRLIVLGGEGSAASPGSQPVVHFANNNGWYDTSSDGPVNATVRFRNQDETRAAQGAWVICAPPKFAPAIRNVVTLYDVLFHIAVKKEWKSIPDRPSFRFDIYPVLYRAISLQWLLAPAGAIHDVIRDAFPPAADTARAAIFSRLRNPKAGSNSAGMNMPQLFDDNNDWVRNGDGGLAFTPTTYELLRRWSIGQFESDWTGEPPAVPTDITPAGLDQAALENCSGGGFFPGIEAGWLLRDVLDYEEPFRLKTDGLRAGDITRQMAVPWQADFFKCTRAPGDGGRQVGWWPQQRPDDVFASGSASRVEWIRDRIRTHIDMVNRWFELGFVVETGTRFIETERNPDPT